MEVQGSPAIGWAAVACLDDGDIFLVERMREHGPGTRDSRRSFAEADDQIEERLKPAVREGGGSIDQSRRPARFPDEIRLMKNSV